MTDQALKASLVAALPLILAGTTVGQTEEPPFEDTPSLGPSSVGAQIKADNQPRETLYRFEPLREWARPYFEWKLFLEESAGFALGSDYTFVGFGATETLPGNLDHGLSGNWRVYADWTAVGRGTANTGALVVRGETRHRLSTIPASGLGPQSGYLGSIAPTFDNTKWLLSNFYWLQQLSGGQYSLFGGFVDVTDYYDAYALLNPWTSFMNLVFLNGSGTAPIPTPGLGAGATGWAGDHWYVSAGIADANGMPTRPLKSFDSFFSDNEYFTHAELGRSSARGDPYESNVHVTIWHADARTMAGTPDGWGGNFSATHVFKEAFVPFLRGGFSEDGGALYETSVTGGVGVFLRERSDLLGVGVNWAEPSTAFGVGLPDQVTSELFYRIQLSPHFELTPDLQWVVDPALNPGVDSIFYFGLRARLVL